MDKYPIGSYVKALDPSTCKFFTAMVANHYYSGYVLEVDNNLVNFHYTHIVGLAYQCSGCPSFRECEGDYLCNSCRSMLE